MAFPRSRVLPYTILQQTPASAGPDFSDDFEHTLNLDDEPAPEAPRPSTPSPHLYIHDDLDPEPTIISWPPIHNPGSARESKVSPVSSARSSRRCNTPSAPHRPASRLWEQPLDFLSGPKVEFNATNLHLVCHNLAHPGAKAFLRVQDAVDILAVAVEQAVESLYAGRSLGQSPRCITLKLCPMGGVAYTKGSELDDLHKEITLSTDYLSKVSPDIIAHEIRGVVLHEVVHCIQWHGKGTAPSGLIEGVADWVRLKAGLAPPHWKRTAEGSWDQGYEKTAYFLDWLAGGEKDALLRVNHYLKDSKYEEDRFWMTMFGGSVDTLWREYAHALRAEELAKQAESDTKRPSPFMEASFPPK